MDFLFGKRKKRNDKGGGNNATPSNKDKDKIPDIIFAPILPFKKFMMKYLDDAKIKYNKKDLSAITMAFFNSAVKGKNKFDTENFLDEFDEFDNFGISDIKIIVDAIVKFFNKTKEKKDSGQPMTPTEKKIVEIGTQIKDQVDTTIAEIKDEETSGAIGDFVKDNMLIIAVIAIGLLVALGSKLGGKSS